MISIGTGISVNKPECHSPVARLSLPLSPFLTHKHGVFNRSDMRIVESVGNYLQSAYGSVSGNAYTIACVLLPMLRLLFIKICAETQTHTHDDC